MKKVRRLLQWVGMSAIFLASSPFLLLADNDVKVSSETLPGQFAFVQGDFEKFQAHHWIKKNYVGGIENFLGEYNNPNFSTSMDSRAILGNGDYEGVFVMTKGPWFTHFNYEQFRKYYSGRGGVYHRFTRFSGVDLDRELALDIAHIEIETGRKINENGEISFSYEHEFKDGAKSRLTWTPVTEGAVTRGIGPSWQEIDEDVDIFRLKIEDEIKGFTVKGEQSLELFKTKSRRYERSLSTNAGAVLATVNQRRVRIQDQVPEGNLMSSMLELNRWSFNDKVFSALAYRFARLDVRELENLKEFDDLLNPRSLSANSENKFDARSHNNMFTHTWVMSLMTFPWNVVNIGSRFKAELMERKGGSTYPGDFTDPPDNVIDRTEKSSVNNKIKRLGQAVTFRYKGIPRTALYTDFELEEVFNDLTENRTSIGRTPSANEVFFRNTLTPSWRAVGTAGGNFSPWRFLNMTHQFRIRSYNNNYDDRRETSSTGTAARSAFFDELDIRGLEASSRVSLKFCRWFQPSVRHQWRDTKYFTRVENQGEVETGMLSHVYTFDMTLIPRPDIFITGSYSKDQSHTQSERAMSLVPTFNSGVDSWFLSILYMVNEKIHFNGAVLYSHADNFNDFTAIGLPLGADFNRVDVTFGCKWTPRKNFSLGPKYEFYHYGANHKAEYGDYNVNIAGLEASLAWG
ncbi:MAG: hypothetical protein A3C35_05380 [Omnitrophica bacterium RIFCSPHIGHO2_02_FULL_46_11]|nr:MAG: hypothetical protein A3A81_02825 [Omnitrophica bacterium RIFCSPLOWO2_01_FULL_45_10b]OGW86826.1 MAG: hypothetical protein A3C35_05380 [Omnitrophica bacterium RIFCSPHIGHO2_02_FULL_46_11]